MPSTTFRKGDWKSVCDICGQDFHASQLKLMWNGLRACTINKCWNPRHPQDFLKGVKDDPSVAWTRPVGSEIEQDRDGWLPVEPPPKGTFSGEL